MRRILLLPLALFFTNCDRVERNTDIRSETKESNLITKRPRPELDMSERSIPVPTLERLDPAMRAVSLRDLLFHLPDDRIDVAMEAIDKVIDQRSQRDLLSTLHRDLMGRDEIIRLPGLIAIAQHNAADESLKTTVYADLRRDLNLAYMPDSDVFASLVEEHMASGNP